MRDKEISKILTDHAKKQQSIVDNLKVKLKHIARDLKAELQTNINNI